MMIFIKLINQDILNFYVLHPSYFTVDSLHTAMAHLQYTASSSLYYYS